MVRKPNEVPGIDPASWQVQILPFPKRYTRGAAFGFCGGHPVGRVEAARSTAVGCWWPEGRPELLTLAGHEDVTAGRASGTRIPGQWRNHETGAMGATVWVLEKGRLEATDLQEQSFASSWATAADGGTVVGVGSPHGKPGERARNVGLVWHEGAKPIAVAAEGDVALFATAGLQLAGSIQGRAAVWATPTAPAVDLSPPGMSMSEVQALDGELQVGVAWKRFCARAALWRATASSFLDLTPRGFQTGSARGAAGGYQVGSVRQKDTTRNGSAGDDNVAVLWQGAPDRWLDLNEMLPSATYNASIAWAIEVRDDVIRICGEASRFEIDHPGTAQEGHVVPVAHPALWTARRG